MQKIQYESPEMEAVIFEEADDVITMSLGGTTGGTSGGTTGWGDQ